MQRRSNERGAALPLLALVLVSMSIGIAVMIGLTGRVVDRAQAQAAADAAALGGVMEGRAVAERLAMTNGARLITFERSGNHVRVVVEVDGWRAEARAERDLLLE